MSQPPVTTAKMTPKTDTQGVKVKVDPFYLDDIPGAMDKMGWKVSAQMMRHWFAGKPAWVMTDRTGDRVPPLNTIPSDRLNDSIIKMDWALNFKQVKEAYQNLLLTWNTDNSRRLLKTHLIKAGWANASCMTLGRKGMSAKDLDSISQVNFCLVGSYTDTLNDYYGAVFKANLKIAVAGYTTGINGRPAFIVEALGLYLRDTYDFNSDWYTDIAAGLGIWSKDRCLTKAEMMLYKSSPAAYIYQKYNGFVTVTNQDFKNWQKIHNEGRDFYVLSDVKWETPKNADKIIFL